MALRTPSAAVTARWVLASARGWSHVITMPGVTREQLDAFVSDLEASLSHHDGREQAGGGDVGVPRPRAELPASAGPALPVTV